MQCILNLKNQREWRSMVKSQKYYEGNEKETYGLIPNVGEFFALIQIYSGFDYESSLPFELLNQVCIKEFDVLPQCLSPTPLDGDTGNKIRINISVNQNKIRNYVIRERDKPDRWGSLPPLA